jgi:hypothetical protein
LVIVYLPLAPKGSSYPAGRQSELVLDVSRFFGTPPIGCFGAMPLPMQQHDSLSFSEEIAFPDKSKKSP